MQIIKKSLIIISKTLAVSGLIALLAITATSISPVYRFHIPEPFTGPDIYDPYAGTDTSTCWKRANFHTHTRVEGPLNECDFTPEEVLDAYDRFGYDIVTFSNHNKLTDNPLGSEYQADAYEHGYNLLKFHKLVFGCSDVKGFDHLVPLTVFQKQFQFDILGKDCDFIQFNHPLRTEGLSRKQMERLEGYRLIELDSGRSTENEYWDWALSAGIYSFGVANDDLHYPDRSGRIAVRSNFLDCKSNRYEDVKSTLLSGAFYAMRIPDYGNGDWEVKYAKNKELPYVREIGLRKDTIHIALSEPADSIVFTGQDHRLLHRSDDTNHAEYAFRNDDSYARITAYFPDGEVIYSNPFARYDKGVSASPFKPSRHTINIILTLLYNLALVAIFIGLVLAVRKLIKNR
jgi:hypothetical protein